ncbi:hypothetical protein PMAYCL1PPCAC_28137, partial [Pristionchus mayeri]
LSLGNESHDLAKLLVCLEAIEKCFPIVGKDDLQPEVKGIVELMENKLYWAIEVLEKNYKKKRMTREFETNLRNIVICDVRITYELIKEMDPPPYEILKPLTDRFLKPSFCNITSPLRLATILIKKAPDHTFHCYKNQICDLIPLRAWGENPEYTLEAGWTIAAMASSNHKDWRKKALDMMSDIKEIIKRNYGDRAHEEQTKRREIAVFALVNILSHSHAKEVRYDWRGQERNGKYIRYLIEYWLPITLMTELFDDVYTFLAFLIE